MSARAELHHAMTHNHLYMTDEPANELIDAALREHAHELAERIRRELPDGPAVAGIVVTHGAAEAADLIDPEKRAALTHPNQERAHG